MELTPIKIRGKGPRKKGFRPPQPKRKQPLSGGATTTTPKRRKRKARAATPIERLPLEILERIFHLSSNLSLPRASLRIGYHLSARSFLLELLVSAFAPTWDVWFGCTRGPEGRLQSYYGYDTDERRIGGDPDLQSDVLACPWATLPRILDALQIWYGRHGRGRYYEHVSLQCQPWTPGPPLPIPCPPLHEPHPGGFDHVKSIHACFEADWQLFAARHDCRTPTWATTHLGVHPRARLPEDAVAGPFDWEKARRLFWLRGAGAALAPGEACCWELTRQGFDGMMRLDDDALALCLARLYESWDVFAGDWPEHVQEEVLVGLEARLRDPGNRLPMACGFVFRVLSRCMAGRL